MDITSRECILTATQNYCVVVVAMIKQINEPNHQLGAATLLSITAEDPTTSLLKECRSITDFRVQDR